MPRVTEPTTRFTADEFERMTAAGLFDDGRVELINGSIYRVAPQNDPHMTALSKSHRAVQRVALPTDWPLNHGTLRVDRHTTIDPDLLWLPVPEGTPWKKWPLPLLVIEISDSTYKRDSGIKLRKYAKIGIADYWFVNLKASRVEVYRGPKNPSGRMTDCAYADVTHYQRGAILVPLMRPDVTIRYGQTTCCRDRSDPPDAAKWQKELKCVSSFSRSSQRRAQPLAARVTSRWQWVKIDPPCKPPTSRSPTFPPTIKATA